MSAFVVADIGVKDPELIVPEVAVGSTPDLQVAESQAGTPQTIQRVESSLIPANGDTTMGEASEVTVSDSGSRFHVFLAHFDLLEFNSLLASHFHRFGPPFGNFLRFSMSVKGLALLKGLFKTHEDFTKIGRAHV